VARLVKRCGGRRPVMLGVVKAEWRDGRVYAPLLVLLKEAGFGEKDLYEEWEKDRRQ